MEHRTGGKQLKNGCVERVYMTGSQMYVTRVIRSDSEGKTFIKWYGELIEVKRNGDHYSTCEAY